MNSRIIFENDEGGVSIIVPAVSVELAKKDVPAGKEYWIVDVSDIPEDRTFRNAWELDSSMGAAHGIGGQ
jgi:hypothetical protein